MSWPFPPSDSAPIVNGSASLGRNEKGTAMNDPQSPLHLIFNQALEIADERQRRDFLSSACGPDVALRKRVDELIVAHFAAGGFLKPPEAATGDDAGTTLTH